LVLDVQPFDEDKNTVTLPSIKKAHDNAVIKSIQQNMKNVNQVYKVVVLRLSDNQVVFAEEAVKFLIEQGFRIFAMNVGRLKSPFEQVDLYQIVANQDGAVVEQLHLDGLEDGAYMVNVETHSDGESEVLPCSFKARRILNAELKDIYAYQKRECYYSEYLGVEELISLMRARSDVFEEKLFIRVHQINELALNQEIVTLQELIKIFKSGRVLEQEQAVVEYMTQIVGFFNLKKESNLILMNMNTDKFVNGFRNKLGTASGVQSCQFYILQLLLGIKMENHILNDPKKLKCLKEYDIVKIKSFRNHDSLFQVVVEWLRDFFSANTEAR